MTTSPKSVRLSQTAPWNPRLRNGYRDRFTQVGGRFFKVSAAFLRDTHWAIEEIDADGKFVDQITSMADGLDEARQIIAAVVDGRDWEAEQEQRWQERWR